MNKPDYLYVIVIARPREAVWSALTSPEFTKQYWHNTEVSSDFSVGSTIKFMDESGSVGCEGKVLVSDYPAELTYTWHFPNNPNTKDEAPSRVSFRLESIASGTKLTMIHDRFEPDSKMLDMVSAGWPLVIGGLKTLLETGDAVDFSAGS